MILVFGETSETQSGYTYSFTQKSTTGFAYSPRFGLDVAVTDEFFAGWQFAYYKYSSSIDIEATRLSDNLNLNLVDDFSRNWWSFQWRIGIRL